MNKEFDIKELEKELDNRDINTRISALKLLKGKVDSEETRIIPQQKLMNLHCHTFYSYNAFGYSPCHIAWIAYKNGFEITGIVDFDVIDGMEEFFQAGEILSIKTVVGMETRVYIEEYADKVLNSPNEPGIGYFVGMGFNKRPQPGSFAESILKRIFNIAKQRNISILQKLNPFLKPVEIDFDKDIVQLTVSGNATERHILKAYYERSKEIFEDEKQRSAFWSEKLQTPDTKISELFTDEYKLFELMRAKLIKYGGVGYIDPDPKNFPNLDETIKMIDQMNALSSYAYLNGLYSGEEDTRALLEFFKKKGNKVITTIPDRNWNIEDADQKKIIVGNFHRFMKECRELGLYVIAGTEMNKLGQKIIDDFNVPELKPYQDDFVKGGYFVYEHSKK